jgi:protease-4
MASKKKWTFGCLISLFIFILFIVSVMIFESMITDSDSGGFDLFHTGGKIAIIDVKGTIQDEMAHKVNKQLKKYRKDDSVKAVLIRVNSPGGGVAASQEIYDEVKKVKESGKKVVISMGSVAASGGYYIACPADKIVANPGTITASIGVIASFLNIEGLYDKIGLDQRVIKSGKFKDIGSPTKEMSEAERELLKELIMNMFDQFVDAVSEGRNMTREEVLEIADGRIVTGKQALEAGLVDTLGNYYDAIDITAEMVGMKEPYTVKEEENDKIGVLDLLLGESPIPPALKEKLSQPEFKVEYRMDW